VANKVAVVTGGAGGIGKAVVERLAQAGFDVCIADQNEQAGQEVVELMRRRSCTAEFYQVDLKRAEEIKKLFDAIYAKFQGLDVLVNLAGGTLHKHAITEFPLSQWREVIDVNLKATFLCCQAVSKVCEKPKAASSSILHPISASPAAPEGQLIRPPKRPSLLLLSPSPWSWQRTASGSTQLRPA
jgi:sorbitol-6-phosphate 2-dehydrogenase